MIIWKGTTIVAECEDVKKLGHFCELLIPFGVALRSWVKNPSTGKWTVRIEL